jgi:hypothetical protein
MEQWAAAELQATCASLGSFDGVSVFILQGKIAPGPRETLLLWVKGMLINGRCPHLVMNYKGGGELKKRCISNAPEKV